jgi:hypothetical protein
MKIMLPVLAVCYIVNTYMTRFILPFGVSQHQRTDLHGATQTQPFRGWLWIWCLVSKISYNVDWGLPNLIATDSSAVYEENTIAILLRTRSWKSLPLITMYQGPYFKDPRPWKFNVYVCYHKEAVHIPSGCDKVNI